MFEIVRSAMVGGRVDLAGLCNEKNGKTAVEIGTDHGIFAAEFLERWNGNMLYCVDPYKAYPEMPWSRQADLQMAIAILVPHARRCRIVQATSDEFAVWIEFWVRAVDFVYIDAAHDGASVRRDIHTWWDRLRPGGTLAGDDFDTEHPGVMEAVTEFGRQLDLRVELTTDYNRPPSWYIERPPLET